MRSLQQSFVRSASAVGAVMILGSSLITTIATAQETSTLNTTCANQWDSIQKNTADGSQARKDAFVQFNAQCPNFLQRPKTSSSSLSSVSSHSEAGKPTTADSTITSVDCDTFYRQAVELKQKDPNGPDFKRVTELYRQNCANRPATTTTTAPPPTCDDYRRMLKEVQTYLQSTTEPAKRDVIQKRLTELTPKVQSCDNGITPATSLTTNTNEPGKTECLYVKTSDGCLVVRCPDLGVTMNSCDAYRCTQGNANSTSSVVFPSVDSSSSSSSVSSSSVSSSSSAPIKSVKVATSSSSRAITTEYKDYRGKSIVKPPRKTKD